MKYKWECYQLGHGGELRFEKELKQLVDYLGHPYPEFFGIPPQGSVRRTTSVGRFYWSTKEAWCPGMGNHLVFCNGKHLEGRTSQSYAWSNCPSVWTKWEQDQEHSLHLLPKTWPHGKTDEHAPTTTKDEPLWSTSGLQAVQNPQGFGQRPRLSPSTSPVKKKNPAGRVVSPQHLSRCELYQDPLVS